MSSYMIDRVNRIKASNSTIEIASAINELVTVAELVAFREYEVGYYRFMHINVLQIPLVLPRIISINAFYAVELGGIRVEYDFNHRVVSVGITKRQAIMRGREMILDELRRYGVAVDAIRLRHIGQCNRSYVYGVYEVIEEVDKPSEYVVKLKYYLQLTRPFTVELREVRRGGKLSHSIKLLDS